MKVLEGVTVIDFTQTYGGSFCTMQLADFGAKVIKVDFSSSTGIEILKKMTETAEVIVESFAQETMQKWGLDYESVKKYNPKVIYASLSSFGQTGPMKDMHVDDSTIQAMSGLMDMTGFPESSPVKAGVSVSESLAGLNTALGICMAYYHKLRTGEGQRVDVAAFDSLFGIMESPILFESMLNISLTRSGNNDAATLVPYDTYECKDGYFSVGLASESGWGKFTETIEMPELYNDFRFENNEKRCKNFEELDPILRSYFIKKTKDELGALFSAAGIPNSPVLSVSEIMVHEQLKDREMIVSFEDCEMGATKRLGNPMKMDITPPTYEKNSASRS